MKPTYVVALDQGTTSSRAVLIDKLGHVLDVTQNPFPQIYPQPGWVEHDPHDILSSQISAFAELLAANALCPDDIECIGITNQRETTLVWNRETGKPVANAIVWQCRRTAAIVEELCSEEGVARTIREKTGLVPDAYFSASKITWILDNVEGARKDAEAGKLVFGTVDTWLIWSLTQGKVHATDVTNASRTMLFNIHEMRWDPWLLELFGIPASMLPEVRPSASHFGRTAASVIAGGIPLCGVAGDQQAALFGQRCFEPGHAKNTYGTGCFLLMHTGFEAKTSSHNLITTLAASAPEIDAPEYALEGSVFVAGALMQWLRDDMGLVDNVAETSEMAQSVASTDGVYIVPAFTGLGAPYWDADARGAVYGLTRGTTKAHFVRAALESLAYQVYDLVSAMEADAGVSLSVLKVDGGASKNDFLMQFQSDILRTPLRRPHNAESTALGAAFLAGLTTGFWSSVEELCNLATGSTLYEPAKEDERHAQRLAGWMQAVKRTMS